MYLFPPITNKRQMKPLIMKRDPEFLNDLPLSPPSVYTHYGEQGKYLPQPDKLSWSPQTHMVERSNYHKLSFDLHTHTVTPESTHTQINNVIDKKEGLCFPSGES